MKYLYEFLVKKIYTPTFICRFTYRNVTPLGRWNITHSKNTIDAKIYCANEDHCGTCMYNPLSVKNKNL